MNKNQGILPTSAEVMYLVKEKQLELMFVKHKALTLTEVTNEIIIKGLEAMK